MSAAQQKLLLEAWTRERWAHDLWFAAHVLLKERPEKKTTGWTHWDALEAATYKYKPKPT